MDIQLKFQYNSNPNISSDIHLFRYHFFSPCCQTNLWLFYFWDTRKKVFQNVNQYVSLISRGEDMEMQDIICLIVKNGQIRKIQRFWNCYKRERVIFLKVHKIYASLFRVLREGVERQILLFSHSVEKQPELSVTRMTLESIMNVFLANLFIFMLKC